MSHPSRYPCVYCGKEIQHGTQPVSTEARCWECWGKALIKDRDALRREATRLYFCLMAACAIGIIGWLR